MEKEEFLPDDLLKDLFRSRPLDSPGDRFVENVMHRIATEPAAVPVKRSFLHYVRSSWAYVALALFCVLILMTSDFSFTDYLPGKEYFVKNFLPGFGASAGSFWKALFNDKSVSIMMMIVIATLLLIGLDRLFFRKPSAENQISQ